MIQIKHATLMLSIFFVTSTAPMVSFAQNQNFQLKDGETIVFLGDSITQAASQPEGFISLIELFCGVNGIEIKAFNAGIGGNKSNDMLNRLDRDVLRSKPDLVVISCGVNDVWHSFKETPSGVDLPDYKKNMTEIMNRCRMSGAKILLLTATPIYEDPNSEENKKLAPYNEFLRTYAKEKNILLCDLNQAFLDLYKKKLNDKKLLTIDGVHMNPRGNRLMARQILRTLGSNWQMERRAEDQWELVNNMREMGQ